MGLQAHHGGWVRIARVASLTALEKLLEVWLVLTPQLQHWVPVYVEDSWLGCTCQCMVWKLRWPASSGLVDFS